MSVSFSEFVELKEYNLYSFESKEKREQLREIKQTKVGKGTLTRILYGTFPTEEEYVKIKMEGKKSMRCVVKTTQYDDYTLLYNEHFGKKIKYKYYENKYGKLVIEIKLKQLGPVEFEIYYISQGSTYETMIKSDYIVKKKLINRLRELCEENEIY